jgi:hypothetical protein
MKTPEMEGGAAHRTGQDETDFALPTFTGKTLYRRVVFSFE